MGCSSSKSAAPAADKQHITGAADPQVPADTPKTEEPKVEEPRADEPKTEMKAEAKADEPKTEMKAEAKADEPETTDATSTVENELAVYLEWKKAEAEQKTAEVQILTAGGNAPQTACSCSFW